ncbi:uncharacterized protein LOC131245724 isoform X2 [Magnolia sinica]|uniref:uncharacterized protein LOC131245724 isoform X2 n=1 Tax=Magnolia sinica TaxID=86752 RepID=UPI00265972D0|nr:uncharacterized protein LOC131245724 isoform X2 [Magnolia sinica]
MNDFQNKTVCGFEKRIPGCMGRMVNLFDMSPNIAGNRLLMEKAHGDGGSLCGGQPDVTKKVRDPFGDQIEDKLVAYELKSSSNKKPDETPTKLLIAKEMSKETESRRKQPNIVAKLMGLDDLPTQQPVSAAQRSSPEGYLQNSSARLGPMPKHYRQENGFMDKQILGDVHPSKAYAQEQPECEDVHEGWQQSLKINNVKDRLQQKGRYKESSDEKMTLVRRKFIEAKRLATDDKLHQSREFQDALEILSSNRDLFLQFLQEPNSLFTKHLSDLQSIPPPPQTKRITVLKPSMTVEASRCARQETKREKRVKQVLEATKRDKKKPDWCSAFAHDNADNSPQPTRIVVLKPSPGKTHEVKAVVPSPAAPLRSLQSRDFYGESRTDAARYSRETAKDITRQIRESLSSNKRGEALLSSALSNRCIGEERSLNVSENEYIEEGNFSDSEIMTPTSGHSWDYINRYGSPCSSSSLSRASYSPESAVTREAKKRLSERLAMIMSAGSGQEQRQLRRSSSTLREMLALPQMKKTIGSIEADSNGEPSISSSRSCGGEQEPREPIACLLTSQNEDEDGKSSPRNLLRSKSVPVSSTVYEKVGLSVEAPDPTECKPIVPKEAAKLKSGKFFKGKVSSLFFSRNKKPSKEKSSLHPPIGYNGGPQSVIAKMPEVLPEIKQLSAENRSDDISQCVTNHGLEEKLPLDQGGSLHETSTCIQAEQGTLSSEEVLTWEKTGTLDNSSEKQDRPSPVSIFEAPFEDDVNTPQLENVSTDDQESHVHIHFKCESAANSSIESVTHSLPWDDDCSESPTPNALEPSTVSCKAGEEEQERFWFVQTLLASAGLDREKSSAVFARWHSPESLLDPTLLDKFMGRKEDEQQKNEAKRRQQRSEWRLIFDSVNATLADMAGYRLNGNPWAMSCSGRVPKGTPLREGVWSQVRKWFSGEVGWFSGESDSGMMVERVVRKEVGGRGWEELMGLEVDRIGEEIEGKMLKELVDEALAELTYAVCCCLRSLPPYVQSFIFSNRNSILFFSPGNSCKSSSVMIVLLLRKLGYWK